MSGSSLIPLTTCLVKGVHFVPQARLHYQPQYRWTAGLLALVAVLEFAAVLWGAVAEAVLSVVGYGAAVILWISAAHFAVRN